MVMLWYTSECTIFIWLLPTETFAERCTVIYSHHRLNSVVSKSIQNYVQRATNIQQQLSLPAPR